MFRKFARLWPHRPRSVLLLALIVSLATATILFLWLPVQPRWSFTTGIHPRMIGFTPDGRRLLVNPCGWQGPIWLFDTASGRLVNELLTHDWVGTCAPALSPDGKLLACMDDRTLLLVEVSGGRVIETIRLSRDSVWGECRFSPDGKTLVYKVCDPETSASNLTIWDVPSRQVRFALQHEGFPAIFSNDSLYLITGTPTSAVHDTSTVVSGEIKVWDAQTGQLFRTLRGHDGGVWRLALTPDGKTLTAGCWIDGRVSTEHRSSIKLWDVTTWEELGTLKDGNFPVLTLDGKLVTRKHDVSARPDTINFLDARTGQLSSSFSSPFQPTGQAYADSPTMSPDGRFITMGMGHRIGPGKLREQLATSTGVQSLANSTCWYELKLFDPATGEVCATIPGDCRSDMLLALKPLFSPDGTMLATSSYEQIRLWDVPPRQPIAWVIALSMLPALLVLATGFRSQLGRKLVFLANKHGPV